MKNAVRKQVSMRTLLAVAAAATLFLMMALSNQAAVMTAGWTSFKDSMTEFFYNGLGGDGTQGLGIVIAVIGVVMAVISFVVHKLNPQSRLPGWFTCLGIAVIGTLLFSGVGPVLKIIQWIRDTVFGWFGFSGFGDFN